MAYQNWDLKLPESGDAKDWVKLNRKEITQNGTTYTLALSKEPRKDSIMILAPEDSTRYGHVAWVKEVHEGSVTVLESTVYPQNLTDAWHGCFWREKDYKYSKIPSAQYLYIKKVAIPYKNLILIIELQTERRVDDIKT